MNQPISEQFRLVAKAWADAESAAHLLEETKTTVLEQRKTKLIEASAAKVSEAAAERLVKSSKEWAEFVHGMCRARSKANLLKVKMRYVEMRHREWIGHNADARQEMRLGVVDP